MWGALLGAVASLGGGIANAITGYKSAKRREAELDRRERENQAWYDRRYNEVGHERADARRLVERMKEAQRDRMNRAAGAQAVVGASSGLRASEQSAANAAIGDVVSKADAMQESRRDKVEAEYRRQKDAISAARNRLSELQSMNAANAFGQASQLAAGMAGAALDGGSGKVGAGDGGSAAQSSPTTPTGNYFAGAVPQLGLGTTSEAGKGLYGKKTRDVLIDREDIYEKFPWLRGANSL